MSDIFDYLAWRGDISFGNAPLCPVDALIFSALPYIRQEPIVPSSFREEPVRLADAAKVYFEHPVSVGRDTSLHHRLLREMARMVRFSSLRLIGARKVVDPEKGTQFAALTILLPGQNLFIAFEGTDNTLVGWQENFRMSYECPVPAQTSALEYLRSAARAFPLRRIFVGGHSKGGNLALYAAVLSGEEFSHRIRAVYNNDGPGFCNDTIASPAYLSMKGRIHTYLPQSSIVAVLLEHDDNYKIVKSSAHGLWQHDFYTWDVLGNDFVFADARTAFGRETEEIVDRFVASMTPARKKEFAEALFTVLDGSNEDTLTGINQNKLQSIRNMIRAYGSLDREMKRVLTEAVASLYRSRREVKKERKSADTLFEKSEGAS